MNHTDLHFEFWRAVGRARTPRVAAMLAELRLTTEIPWGLGRVQVRGRYYEPTTDLVAPFAIIAPVVAERTLIDLCAIRLPEGVPHTRAGIGMALGEDEIDAARWQERTLILIERPLHWLRAPKGAACILDWTRARAALDGVGKVRCNSLELAEQVEQAFVTPASLPPLIGVER